MDLGSIWMSRLMDIQRETYDITTIKERPSKWIEDNIFLPSGVSRYTGKFSYDYSPYAREIVDRLASSDPARAIAVMKGAQSGLTQGVIVPGIAYIIAQDAAPILFTAGDKELARKTIRERFDPIIESSGLKDLIKPNVIRKKNQRTGDTDTSKEYAGGALTIEGTNNVNKLRQYSVKIVFADDYEAAPRTDKEEGSIRKLIEGRQTSYGNLAKTFFISTPKIKQTSNIEPVYLLGDQRKWHWTCPHCNTEICPEWRIELGDGDYAGIVYKLDDRKRIINKSVAYKCQNCRELIPERMKYDLNLKGRWIPTAEPEIENYYSYQLNSLIIPPGFITWVDLAKEWNEACPVGEPVDREMLKAFVTIRLGQTFEEQGESPKVIQLMRNTREYEIGIIPDITSDEDQNGKIVMLTLAVDINGIMKEVEDGRMVEDVRADWEILAHSETGATYSIDHGSIGTFKRRRERSKKEQSEDFERDRWTITHNVERSIWPELEKIMRATYFTQSGEEMNILITLVDTGFGEKHAMQFIKSVNDLHIYGVKGRTEKNYRSIMKDTSPIKRSTEQPKYLYILEVDQIKDDLAEFMKARLGEDDSQPKGFMNFPQPSDGKYTLKSYFIDYEGERRTEDLDSGGNVIGYKWEKKNTSARNHYWDVRVYNLAAPLIYIDLIKRSDSKYKDLNYETFVALVTR